MLKSDFTLINDAVFQAGLTPVQFTIYCYIKRRMWQDIKSNKYLMEVDGVVCASLHGLNYRQIAAEAHVSKSSINPALEALVEKGLMFVKRSTSTKMTNEYFIPYTYELVNEEEPEEPEESANSAPVEEQEVQDIPPVRKPKFTRGYTPEVKRESEKQERHEENRRNTIEGEVPTRSTREVTPPTVTRKRHNFNP